MYTATMLPFDAPELAHCRATLLPIWELWTDGDLALRRPLECGSADPASHREVRKRLLARVLALVAAEDGTPAAAAGWRARPAERAQARR